MNKEQIIDEAYDNFLEKMVYHPEENWLDDEDGKKTYRQLTQEEFIEKCKTDSKFSEKWGLKIEERELSLEERQKLYEDEFTSGIEVPNNHWLNSKLTTRNIPTKLITITYNNETIKSYE